MAERNLINLFLNQRNRKISQCQLVKSESGNSWHIWQEKHGHGHVLILFYHLHKNSKIWNNKMMRGKERVENTKRNSRVWKDSLFLTRKVFWSLLDLDYWFIRQNKFWEKLRLMQYWPWRFIPSWVPSSHHQSADKVWLRQLLRTNFQYLAHKTFIPRCKVPSRDLIRANFIDCPIKWL